MTSFVLNIDENSKLGKSIIKFLNELEGKEVSIKALDKFIDQAEDSALGEIMLNEQTGEYVTDEEVIKKLSLQA